LKYLSVLVLFIISVSVFSYEIENYSEIFIDEDRDNREIEVEIFYPVNADESISFPVIVFGHGWLMNFNSYGSFTQEMVSSGLIVIFPRTEEGITPNHQDFALDISFLKDAIQQENSSQSSNLFNIVMNKTFAAGHSMGGGSSILASNLNESFSGLFNFAAAETNPSAIAAAENVDCPSIIFSANDDNIAPAEENQLPMYQNLASTNKFYINILNEGHINITENVNISTVILPFINYIISDDDLYLQMLSTKLDSLQTNNFIEFETVNDVSIDKDNMILTQWNLDNYPNPFNPTTTIKFSLQNDSSANISIYNIKGQKIVTLLDNQITEGTHSIIWNGKDDKCNPVSSGVYYYKLIIDNKIVKMKKCLLLK
jgi:dienelactone hydrolase